MKAFEQLYISFYRKLRTFLLILIVGLIIEIMLHLILLVVPNRGIADILTLLGAPFIIAFELYSILFFIAFFCYGKHRIYSLPPLISLLWIPLSIVSSALFTFWHSANIISTYQEYWTIMLKIVALVLAIWLHKR
jgi:hypothetical protein